MATMVIYISLLMLSSMLFLIAELAASFKLLVTAIIFYMVFDSQGKFPFIVPSSEISPISWVCIILTLFIIWFFDIIWNWVSDLWTKAKIKRFQRKYANDDWMAGKASEEAEKLAEEVLFERFGQDVLRYRNPMSVNEAHELGEYDSAAFYKARTIRKRAKEIARTYTYGVSREAFLDTLNEAPLYTKTIRKDKSK